MVSYRGALALKGADRPARATRRATLRDLRGAPCVSRLPRRRPVAVGLRHHGLPRLSRHSPPARTAWIAAAPSEGLAPSAGVMDDCPNNRASTCAGFIRDPSAPSASDFMTRTLILIRHAKSDWDDPALDDHDRPLKRARTAQRAAHRGMAGRSGDGAPMPSSAPPRSGRARPGRASPRPCPTRRSRSSATASTMRRPETCSTRSAIPMPRGWPSWGHNPGIGLARLVALRRTAGTPEIRALPDRRRADPQLRYRPHDGHLPGPRAGRGLRGPARPARHGLIRLHLVRENTHGLKGRGPQGVRCPLRPALPVRPVQ